jgi:hypothetical protein
MLELIGVYGIKMKILSIDTLIKKAHLKDGLFFSSDLDTNLAEQL